MIVTGILSPDPPARPLPSDIENLPSGICHQVF
jgi:hypothetical protein